MTDIALLYVTTPSREVAQSIAHILVEEKLAACVNILGDIQSIYRWEGKIETGAEVALLVKTTAQRVDAVISRITALHPHECPAILQLPIEGGFAPFMDWIKANTNA